MRAAKNPSNFSVFIALPPLQPLRKAPRRSSSASVSGSFWVNVFMGNHPQASRAFYATSILQSQASFHRVSRSSHFSTRTGHHSSRAFLVLVYSDLGERSATNTTYGKSVFRRSSSEAARGPRPWGGESTGTREAVWGQRSLCLEDFPAASANRPDGAGATAAWPTKPDDPRGPVEFARSAAAAARLHTARATAPSGRAGPSES